MPKFMKMLNDISRSQAIYRQGRVAAPDLATGHYALILAVCREPGRSQEELAQELCLNKSTVTRSLACLEEHGYIERAPHSDDRRRLSVYPTARAQAVLPRLRAASRDWMRLLTEGIPEEELAVFYAVLERMEARARAVLAGEGEA